MPIRLLETFSEWLKSLPPDALLFEFGFVFILISLVLSIITLTTRLGKSGDSSDFVLSIVLLLASMGILLLLGGVIGLVIRYSDQLTKSLSNPSVAFLAIIGATLLYVLRSKKPFIYGGLEMIAGVSSIFLATLGPVSGGLIGKVLGIFGGIYIIVRGIDNAKKSLSKFWAEYTDTFDKRRLLPDERRDIEFWEEYADYFDNRGFLDRNYESIFWYYRFL